MTRLRNAAVSQRRKQLEFSVTTEYLWTLFEKQLRECAISGVAITLPKSLSTSACLEATASLDRIDNSLGYVEGNVQWVHKQVNMMRRDLDVDTFVAWCRRIAYHRS